MRSEKTRISTETKTVAGTILGYFYALLTALIIAFILRSFVIEAFKIPSKSMVPTLLVGDHLFVNKFIYGIRLPFTKKWIAHFKKPERGEVIVFIYPKDESLDFIKRVVGLPGDQVEVRENNLYINGEKVNKTPVLVQGIDPNNKRKLLVSGPGEQEEWALFKELPFIPEWKEYDFYAEQLGTKKHWAQQMKMMHGRDAKVTVPEGHLFVMGDNRDNSSDSREWGFVPMENMVGKAMFIWLSMDHDQGGIRWNRFGKWIH